MAHENYSSNAKTEYWANSDIKDIADEILAKFSDYQKWLWTSGYANRIQTSYNAFYNQDKAGSLKVIRNGDEIAQMNVNHFKALLQRLHLLVTENKLDYQPISRTSDSKSMVTSDLAKGICSYYGDSKNMNQTLSQSVLGSLVEMEQFIHCPWDISEGYELTADGSQVVKTGDQRFELYGPFHVARNTTEQTSNWFIVRQKVNKWDMAQLHPEFAEDIKSDSINSSNYDVQSVMNGSRSNSGLNISPDSQDYCYKYILYHARTPACPDGKHVEIVAGQVLSFGNLKYEKVPVFRITAGDQLNTTFADSPAIVLLPIQQALDQLFSAVTTNNLNNAVQMIHSSDPNFSTQKLENGQVLVKSAQPPTALNLTGSSAETYKLMDLFIQQQQLLSGINDVARGNPGASVKTSGGQALMLAQAFQFVNALAKNYSEVASEVATCLINNIKAFANEEMGAHIVGTNKKGEWKKFKAKDVIDVSRISISLGNPLTSSYAGRSELMSQWVQMSLIKDPQQIVTFLQTGNLEQAIEEDWSDALLINEENEQIKSGIKPVASLLDNHVQHILKHKACSSSPEARSNPTIMAAQLDHIQEHIGLMRQVPPDLAAVIAGQPLPPLNPTPPPAGQTNPNPAVNGEPLPNVPNSAPAQVASNYQQATANIPNKGN